MLFYPQLCGYVCVCMCGFVGCSMSREHGQTHYPSRSLCMLPVIFSLSSLLSWLLFSRRASGRPLFICCFLCSVCYQTFSWTRVSTIPRPPHAFCLSHGTAHNTMNTSRRNYFGLKVAGNRWRKVFFFAEKGEAEGRTLQTWGGRKCCTTATKNDLRWGTINSFERFDHLVFMMDQALAIQTSVWEFSAFL